MRRVNGIQATALTVAAFVPLGAAQARDLIRFEPDFREKLVSVRFMDLAEACTADDIIFTREARIRSVHAFFLVPVGNELPLEWNLRIVGVTDEGLPDEADELFNSSDARIDDLQDIVEVKGEFFSMYLIKWNLEEQLRLDAGTYWIIPKGVRGEGLVYWAAANSGMQFGSSAMLKSAELGVPNWTTWQIFTKDCLPVDGAMIVQGTGGGVPNILPSNVKSVRVNEGEHIRGRKRSLSESEGIMYTAEADTGGNRPTMRMGITYKVPQKRRLRSIILKMSSVVDEPGSIVVIRFWNYRSNEWDVVEVLPGTTQLDYCELSKPDEQYVKRRKAKVRIDVHRSHGGEPFRISFDQIRLESVYY